MWHGWGRGERHTGFWWGKPKQKNKLKKKWADNIKVDLKDRVFECMEWIKLAQVEDSQLAPMNSVKNLQIP